MKLPADLIEAVADRDAILFVGAGVSMSAGLPSWAGLIRDLAPGLGYDEDVFLTLGDNLSLAEYFELETGSIGPLRSRLDAEWHGSERRSAVQNSAVHRLIAELDFSLIYTTNYDRYLEWTHEDNGKNYKKISGVSDLGNCAQVRTQIVKFHGDFDSDDSLVLTESSFFRRMDFKGALDLKLQGDMLGRTILFIGYSVSDLNIRLLLFRLNQLWKEAGDPAGRANSYLFMTRPNPIQQRLWRSRGVVPLVAEQDDAGEATRRLLEDLLEQVKARNVAGL